MRDREEPGQSNPSPARACLLDCVLVASVVVALYAGALGHNFLFDEGYIVERNPAVREALDLQAVFRSPFFVYPDRAEPGWEQRYRPLTTLSFALDHAVWGLDPFGYNLTNVLLHVLVACLLLGLLRAVLRGRMVPLAVAVFYAVHPAHVEAVAYLASRADVLVGIFTLAAVRAYLGGWGGSAAVCVACGLLAKESAVLIAPLLLLLELCVLRRGVRSASAGLLPSVVVLVGYLLFRRLAGPVPLPPSPELDAALLRLLSMGVPLLEYLRAWCLPERFSLCMDVPVAPGLFSPEVLTTGLVYSGILVLWGIACRRTRWFAFGIGWFLGGIALHLQWIPFDPPWAEHYLYIPGIGLALAMAAGMQHLCGRGMPGFRSCVVPAGLWLVITAGLAVRTWQRVQLYCTDETFLEHLAGSASPLAHLGYQGLGLRALRAGDLPRSHVLLRTAHRIRPTPQSASLLGGWHMANATYGDALDYFRLAAQSAPGIEADLQVASALLAMERHADARALLEPAVQRAPGYAPGYLKLASAYELAGMPGRAYACLEQGRARLAPNRTDLARLLAGAAGIAYRAGDRERFTGLMADLLRETPDAFWYADVARLHTGAVSPAQFERVGAATYAGMTDAVARELLRAAVLRGDGPAARRILAGLPEGSGAGRGADPLDARERTIAAAAAEVVP